MIWDTQSNQENFTNDVNPRFDDYFADSCKKLIFLGLKSHPHKLG